LLDQDALNFALASDWCALDKVWNTPAGPLDDAPMLRGLMQINPGMKATLLAWRVAQDHPGILHFTGSPKPWEADYPWPELAQRYRECMSDAPGLSWPSSRPDAVFDPSTSQKVREFRRV
jgi:lipopolysaccharide biosynthesis glycosyltransferase